VLDGQLRRVVMAGGILAGHELGAAKQRIHVRIAEGALSKRIAGLQRRFFRS